MGQKRDREGPWQPSSFETSGTGRVVDAHAKGKDFVTWPCPLAREAEQSHLPLNGHVPWKGE